MQSKFKEKGRVDSHTGMHVRAHLQVILPPVTLLLQIPAHVFVVDPTSIWLMHRNAPPLVMCKTCNKKGHSARVCRTVAQTHSMLQVEIPEYTLVFLQQSESPAKLQCTVDIHAGTLQKTVKLTVDAGASVSVLPKCIVEEYFEGVPLQPPAARLVTPKLQSKCWDACLLQW